MARFACICLVILLSSQLIVPYYGQPLNDSKSEGDESKDLNRSENRDRETNADADKSLTPKDKLRNNIEQYVDEFFKPFHLRHSWSLFGDDWGLDTTHWTNLGDQIWKHVEESMKPLNQMHLRLQMKNGECGSTVVTFRPNGKTLLLKDGKAFECPGEISESGNCSTDPIPFKIEEKSDKCFLTPKVIFNDQLCLTTDDITAVTSTTSEGLTCRNSNGDKIEPLRLKDYQELCENIAKEADYKFITDSKIDSELLPEDIECDAKSDTNTTICTFTDKDRLTGKAARIVYSSRRYFAMA